MRNSIFSSKLKRVQPTKALSPFFGPGRKEEEAADIRNLTIDAVQNERLRDVLCLHAKAQHEEKMAFYELVTSAFLACTSIGIIFLMIFSPEKKTLTPPEENRMLFAMISLFIGIGCIFLGRPAISNTRRYRITKKICAEYLVSKLGKNILEDIEKLKFNPNDVGRNRLRDQVTTFITDNNTLTDNDKFKILLQSSTF